MKFKANSQTGQKIEIDAEPVQLTNNHGYEFVIHRSVDEGQWGPLPAEKRPFVISEITSGSSVAQGRTASQCIQQAEDRLGKVTKEYFDEKIKETLFIIEWNNEPFSKTVLSTGITLLDSEIEDLRTALKDLLK